MNENKKKKTTLFQREIKVQKPSKNTKKGGGEKGASRDPGLLLLTEPTHTSRHTQEIPSQLTTQGRKKNSDTQQLRRVRGVFHLKVARRGRKKEK